MGLQINGSGASLFALRQLDRSTRGIAEAQERLSTLLRINRAADDAAGLAIAEGFRSDIRELNTEVRSIQTGINATQTAEAEAARLEDAIKGGIEAFSSEIDALGLSDLPALADGTALKVAVRCIKERSSALDVAEEAAAPCTP